MNLYLINFLFLIPLTAIGLICSYTDIKNGKILNKWVLLGFLCAFLLYFSLFSHNIMAGNKEIASDIFRALLNGLAALLAGYLLWHFKLWSAGDAKLFAVYSFLIPWAFYPKSHVFPFSFFPSFYLLINLFILLLAALAINAFFTLIKRRNQLIKKIGEIKLLKTFHFLLQMFLNYAFVIVLLQVLVSLIKNSSLSQILLNPFLIFALLFLIMSRFSAARKKWLSTVICGTVVLYSCFLVFNGKTYLLYDILKTALIFMVLVGLTRQVLDFYSQEQIRIKDIEKGTIVSKKELEALFSKAKKKGLKEKLGRMDASGFSEIQAKLIKNFLADEEKIKIKSYKSLPLAPFLFISSVILLFGQRSFLSFVYETLQSLIFLL